MDRGCSGGGHQAWCRLSTSFAEAAAWAALTPLVSESWARQQSQAVTYSSCAGLEGSTTAQRVAACILRKVHLLKSSLFKPKLNTVLVETGPTSICWQLCWYKHSSSLVRDRRLGNGTGFLFCDCTSTDSSLVSGHKRLRTRARDGGRCQPEEQEHCFLERTSLPFSTDRSNIFAQSGESRTLNCLISWKNEVTNGKLQIENRYVFLNVGRDVRG